MKSVADIFDSYKERVIDLSRRNRLLKYPKTARSIKFDLSYEEFSESYGILEEFQIEFLHKAILQSEPIVTSVNGIKARPCVVCNIPFIPANENITKCSPECYKAGGKVSVNRTKTEQSSNDLLKKQSSVPPTSPSGEKLITLLNSLRLDTKRKFEEHGLHTLFIAFGRVLWKEKQPGNGSSGVSEEYDYDAPLLLVPIHIIEKKNPKATVIEAHLETNEIMVNKVLSLLLEKEYNTRPLRMKEESFENLPDAMSKISKKINDIFSELKLEFEIKDEIQVGQYTFYGEQIYEDLNRHQAQMLKNEFIDGLCSHTPIQQKDLDISCEDPDNLLSVTHDYNITDADSSQLEVIFKALNKKHLNVQGPPGTGKSQTIVNLISNFIARDMKVLLVCEKQVALEVVLDRLKERGLDKLCLPLFQYNRDKKLFAKSVIEDRNSMARFSNKSELDYPLESRSEKIKRLREYAGALSEVIPPLGKTTHWVHGELSKYIDADEKAVPWKGDNPHALTMADYERLLTLFVNINPIYGSLSDENLVHWRGITRRYYSEDFKSRVSKTLQDLKQILEEASILRSDNCNPKTIFEIRKCHQLQERLRVIEPFSYGVKADLPIPKFVDLLKKTSEHRTSYLETLKSFSKDYLIPHEWIQINDRFNGYLKDEVKIDEIISFHQRLSKTYDQFKVVGECLSNIQQSNILLTLNINEILDAWPLFKIDSIIKNLKAWDQFSSLQSALQQLKNLLHLYDRLKDAKGVIDKWAIVSGDVNGEQALSIGNRFAVKYRSFLRYFKRDYKIDCKTIESWCNANLPQKHTDYFEIIRGIEDWIRLQDKIHTLSNKFGLELISSGQFDSKLVPIYHKNVSSLCQWLADRGYENIPNHFLQLMESNSELESINRLIYQIDLFTKILLEAQDLFNDKHHVCNPSLKQFIDFYPALIDKIKLKCEMNDAVRVFIPEHQYSKSKFDLIEDVRALNMLSRRLAKINGLNLTEIFDHENIVSAVLSEESDILSFKDNIFAMQDCFGQVQDTLTTEPTTLNSYLIVNELRDQAPLINQWLAKYDSLINILKELSESNEIFQDKERLPLETFIKIIDEMLADNTGLEKWMLFRKYAYQIEELGYGWFLETTKDYKVNDAKALFAKSLWSAWLDKRYKSCKPLLNFDIHEHENTIREFQRLEERILEVNAQRTLARLAPYIRTAKHVGGKQDTYLVHQSQLQRSHKSIRRVVEECGSQLIKYKPCWMLSPLTLSSYIPYNTLEFDVVIFDEASQMRVEHALGAIARAKQVIIFGDEHQLPPTSFFEVTDQSDGDEDNEENYESILKASKEILPGADELLSHHYRSKYEELIAFSNHYIYEDRLITFPNPVRNTQAVENCFAGGRYDGGAHGTRSNPIEAKKVVALCVQHVSNNPNKSLGVIAFSKAQETAIRDELIEFVRTNSSFQTKLDETSDSIDSFFIKNLESVQGDERDVIILSVGYGPDKEGNIYNRFGPINSAHGYRRLNVAVTRAKEKLICVNSLHSTDIHNGDKAKGAFLLQKYLDYSENGIKTLQASKLTQSQLNADFDSPFEEEVEKALSRKGLILHKQVGVSGFKIDLAVVNPKNLQEYVLGIECDGASYHSSYSARMRDRVRQEILERLDWQLYRIWSQHWISHKNEIVDDILRRVELILSKPKA